MLDADGGYEVSLEEWLEYLCDKKESKGSAQFARFFGFIRKVLRNANDIGEDVAMPKSTTN